MTQFLLLAHIGGTKARFGLKEIKENSSKKLDDLLYKSRYPIGFFKNPTTMIERFIQEARDSLEYRTDITEKINVAKIKPTNIRICLALAGPVHDNLCDLTSWDLKFDGKFLKKKLGFPRVDLINDFQAVAYGVRELNKLNEDDQDYDFLTLQEPAPPKEDGLIAVIGVATGLGKSFLIQSSNEKEVYAYATEGGHINFAPHSQFELALFHYILNNIKDKDDSPSEDNYNQHSSKRVSVERVVSGRGIVIIYRFLQDCQNNLNENGWLPKLSDKFKDVIKKVKNDLKILKEEVVKSNLENSDQSDKYPLSQSAKETILEIYRNLSLINFLKELEPILEKGIEINSKTEKANKKREIIDKFSEPQAIKQLIKIWQKEDDQCSEPIDPAAVITSAAIRKSDPLSIYTMQIFLEITAGVVSNCASHFLPYGGLYLAGGIPPQIIPLINKDKFEAELSKKDTLSNELAQIPIYVVKNLEAGLIGAAYYAENNHDEKSGEEMKREKTVEQINHEAVASALQLPSTEPLDPEVLQKPKMKNEEKDKRSEDPPHPIGVIVAGTDLEEAFILKKKPDDTGTVFCFQEGSHADFAARSPDEFELIEYIQRKDKLARVSVERVVSVGGIVRIYQFLQDTYSDSQGSEILNNLKNWLSNDQKDQELKEIKDLIGNIDKVPEIDEATCSTIKTATNKADAIVNAALDIDKRDLLCLKTMAMFAEAYGSEVGNFALRVLPYEGLYLAGCISAKILHKESWLQKLFLKELKNKGRMKEIIERIPIYLVKNEQVGLIRAIH